MSRTERVAVIGLGMLGRGIAGVAARADRVVHLRDGVVEKVVANGHAPPAGPVQT